MIEFRLSEDTTERNITMLKLLRTRNKLLERVLQKEESYVDEVLDLFYFFRGFKGYMKNLVKKPLLREDHNQRLQELENVLNEVDLFSLEDEREYKPPKERKYQLFFPSFRPNVINTLEIEVETYPSECYRKMHEGLKGKLNIEDLYEENLEEYLGERRMGDSIRLLIPFSLASGGLVYGLNAHTTDHTIIGSFATFVFSSIILFGLYINKLCYYPPSYYALVHKVIRLDQFIEQYGDKIQ